MFITTADLWPETDECAKTHPVTLIKSCAAVQEGGLMLLSKNSWSRFHWLDSVWIPNILNINFSFSCTLCVTVFIICYTELTFSFYSQLKLHLIKTQQQWAERRFPCHAPSGCLKRYNRYCGSILLLMANQTRWPLLQSRAILWSSHVIRGGPGYRPPSHTVSLQSSLLPLRMRVATPASMRHILME